MKKLADHKRRVIAFLDREEIEFLDKLSMDSSFSTGHKLSRVDIISALVRAAMAMRLSASGIRSREELVERILNLSRTPIERRKLPRIRKGLEVGFRALESLKGHYLTKTEDLGLGGFRMDLPEGKRNLAPHQLIEITLKDPVSSSAAVKAIGKVAWISQKEKEPGFEIGVKFAYMTEQDHERFKGFLSGEPAQDDR